MGVALPGVEAVARHGAPVIDPGVGDVRLQHQIGRHLALQRCDRDAQHQGVAVRVAEDLFLDLEAAVLVARGDAIGGRQRAALRVHVQIFGAAGGVRPFDDQAVMGDAGEAQGLDLGLVDQAVHGLGQDAVGDGIPDLGHRPGRAAVAILAVDIGFVGRSGAGLGGAGPDGRGAGRAGGDARLGGRCGSEGQTGGAGETEGTEVTHFGPHGLRVGAGERRKVRGNVQPLVPGRLVMLGARKDQALEIAGAIAATAERPVHLGLEGGVELIQRLVAPVEIEAVGAGRGQAAFDHAGPGGDQPLAPGVQRPARLQPLDLQRPVGRQTGGGGKDVGPLHHRRHRNQPAHARPGDHRVLRSGQGAIGAVDERLKLLDQKPQIAVGQRRPAVYGLNLVAHVGGQGGDQVGGDIFPQAQVGVPHADDDGRAHLTARDQPRQMLVHAPFAEVGRGRIEQVLAVVHIEDGVAGVGRLITRRNPNRDVARLRMRRSHAFMDDQTAARDGALRLGRAGERQGGHQGQQAAPVHARCSLINRALPAASTKEPAPSTRAQMAWPSNRVFRIRPRTVAASSCGTTIKMLNTPI